ncbi:hypothetical protein BDA96_07G191300 [Sorghum bicolor]|uniref:Uncharacterized protein n=2 Tax=Sorghum bicolor TaxID=4558 RepID=A0A921UB29_SORBI|nr:hypothetical protein SORBI_3007G179700 [Sorghum bicolor]KAG0524215.1 hypothetical protein BDA96_07G191300 [Sorghum bicolor]
MGDEEQRREIQYNTLLRGTRTSSRIRCPVRRPPLLCLPTEPMNLAVALARRPRARDTTLHWVPPDRARRLHAPPMLLPLPLPLPWPSHMPCTPWPPPSLLMATAPLRPGRKYHRPAVCCYGRAVVVSPAGGCHC